MIIADLTKAIPGTEANLVATLRKFAESRTQGVTLVLHRRQIHGLNGERYVWKLVELENAVSWPMVRQAVLQELIALTNPPRVGDVIDVISFHPAILAARQDLPVEGQKQVVSRHWQELLGPRVVQQVTAEHLDLLGEVLRNFPAGVRKTGLRDILVSRSPIFSKDAGGPTITDLLTQGEQAGIITIDRSSDPQNPNVRCRNRELAADSHVLASGSVDKESKEHLLDQTGDAPVVYDACADGSNEQNMSKQSSLPDLEMSGKARLARYRTILREAGLGPYSAIRPSLYESIERHVSDGKLSASVLIRKVVRSVWDTHNRIGNAKRLLWTDVERFLFTLLSRQQVLLGSGEELLNPKGSSACGIPVIGLKHDWRDWLDAELVFAIIDGDRNVTVAEGDDLAFVLFGHEEPEQRWMRIDVLLGKLLGADRIYADHQGRYVPGKNAESIGA